MNGEEGTRLRSSFAAYGFHVQLLPLFQGSHACHHVCAHHATPASVLVRDDVPMPTLPGHPEGFSRSCP